MPVVQPPPQIKERTFVTPGLADQDENIDLLLRYFQEMQKTTVETSQPDDLLSFAACAPYFGVIMLETTTTPLPEEYISDDEDGQELALVMPLEERDESIYLSSSRATVSRPPSTTHNYSDSRPQSPPDSERLQMLRAAASTTPTETLFPKLSPEDKVLLWREAFMAKIEEDTDEPLVPLHGGAPDVRPIYASRFPDVGPAAAAEAPMHMADAADETGSDFINWPDEGPAHEAHTDAAGADAQEADYMVLDGASPILSPHAEDGVGREHLSPEVYTSPAKEFAELKQDPHMQTLVYDSAVRLQQALREKRVKKYLAAQRRQQRARVRDPRPVGPPTTTCKPIGLIYLWTSQTFLDPLHMGECGLGVYIIPEHRGKDCLLAAVDGVVKLAFQDPNCHRLQSIIVENPDKLYTIELLARAGFRNEGIRRRAFFSTGTCEWNGWKDVTYFAMLATEWVYDANNTNSAVRLRTTSLWDEVFARHQKECDDLIRLEEKSTLKRSCSLETIRERVVSSLSVVSSVRGDDDDDATDTGSSVRSGVSMGAKRRRLGYKKGQWRSTAPSSAASMSSGPGSEWEVASVASTSALRAPPRSSASSVSGSTSLSSRWDVL